MKKLIAIILTILLVVNCVQHQSNKKKNYSIAISYFFLNKPIEPKCVIDQYNPSYYATNYMPTYSIDRNKYTNVVIGDSTIDIPFRNGYAYNTSTTKMVAVSGNTLCDMYNQFDTSIPNENFPTNFIISSLGGNDYLRGISDSDILNNFKFMFSKIQERKPSGKIVLIGVHPTLIDSINKRKDANNKTLKDYALSQNSNVCYIEPMDSTGKTSGQLADVNQMLDNIHMTVSLSSTIFDTIPSKCGVSLK